MKKFKLTATVFCALLAVTMAFTALFTVNAKAEEETRDLVILGAYEDAVIPEAYNHDAEYSRYDTNPAKRLDVALRAPGANGQMDGDPMTNPGAPYGNGVNVAQGIAKYKIKYAGGAVRLRYGYTVDLSSANVNLRILSTDNQNGHLNLTFSNDYMAISHDALSFNGFVLDIYKDSPTQFQTALISAQNRRAIEGINQTVFTFPVSDDDPETYCFSVYTFVVDGQYHVKVINKNATAEYVLPASINNQVVREDGTTNIGINCFYNWGDSDPYYTTFVMQVKDSIRTAYEKETVEPLKAQLSAYSAEAINAAEINTVEDVDAFVAKKAAIDNNLVAKLRVSDRDLLKVNAHIAAADAALKEKAGALVKENLLSETNAMLASFENALSDTGYKAITSESEINNLKTLYNALNVKVNDTYASLVAFTDEERNTVNSAFTSASNAIARLDVNKAIYDAEQLPLTTAEELVSAKAKYNELSGGEFTAKINALAYSDEVKAELTARISAFNTKIANAEQNLNKADVIDGQITNYENAAITTVEEMRAALEVKALIEDFTGLDEADEFAARIAAKDAALQNAAYALLEERITTVDTLTKAGLNKASERNTLAAAISAVTDTDLLSDEKKTEVNAVLTSARQTIKDFDDRLKEADWVLASQGGGNATTADVEFLEKGVRFKNGGNGDQLISTKKIAFGADDEIMVKFSVKAFAYLNGDGKGRGSNNTWIFLCDKLTNGGYVNRTTPNSLTLMFWNCVSESFVKTYTTEHGDIEIDSPTMTTFGENDGSYVTVIFKRNDAKNRFEITTTLYSADGDEIDYSLNIVSYSETISGATFDNGVYVGFSAWADENNKYFNEWDIEFLGTVEEYNNSSADSSSTGSDSGDSSDTGSGSSSGSSSEEKGCFGSVGASSCLVMILAGAVAIMRKRKQN